MYWSLGASCAMLLRTPWPTIPRSKPPISAAQKPRSRPCSISFFGTHASPAVARQRLLKVGDTIGNDYVVLDGIKPGDHILLSGLQFLQDGMPVIEQLQGAEKK